MRCKLLWKRRDLRRILKNKSYRPLNLLCLNLRINETIAEKQIAQRLFDNNQNNRGKARENVNAIKTKYKCIRMFAYVK